MKIALIAVHCSGFTRLDSFAALDTLFVSNSITGETYLRSHTLAVKRALVISAVLFAGCNRSAPRDSAPLPQRGYLWQRNWTAAVNDAVLQAQKQMDGVVVLGAEIGWAGKKPEVVRANVNWEMLKSHDVSCSIVLRIAPYRGPFAGDDTTARFIVGVARLLVDLAVGNGIAPCEFQVDFDAPALSLTIPRARGLCAWPRLSSLSLVRHLSWLRRYQA